MEPRQIEQLLDESRQARRRLEHHGTRFLCLAAPRAVWVKRRRGRQDRRQRRAQIVRDRAQDRCLRLVAAPQQCRFDDLGLELSAVQ